MGRSSNRHISCIVSVGTNSGSQTFGCCEKREFCYCAERENISRGIVPNTGSGTSIFGLADATVLSEEAPPPIAVTTGIITKVSASSVHWGRCVGGTTDLG